MEWAGLLLLLIIGVLFARRAVRIQRQRRIDEVIKCIKGKNAPT